MRIILVFALLLAVVTVCSALPNRRLWKCRVCNNLMKISRRSWHRRYFTHIFNLWGCKSCPVQNDKCSPDPCLNDGECQPEDGSCICTPDFSGSKCEVEDKCSPNLCQNGGECQPGDGSCVCTPGFSGSKCEVQAPCFDTQSRPNNACLPSCDNSTPQDGFFCPTGSTCCEM